MLILNKSVPVTCLGRDENQTSSKSLCFSALSWH